MCLGSYGAGGALKPGEPWPPGARPTKRPLPPHQSPPPPKRLRISWNRGLCTFPGACMFKHACALCNSADHKARDCARAPPPPPPGFVLQAPPTAGRPPTEPPIGALAQAQGRYHDPAALCFPLSFHEPNNFTLTRVLMCPHYCMFAYRGRETSMYIQPGPHLHIDHYCSTAQRGLVTSRLNYVLPARPALALTYMTRILHPTGQLPNQPLCNIRKGSYRYMDDLHALETRRPGPQPPIPQSCGT